MCLESCLEKMTFKQYIFILLCTLTLQNPRADCLSLWFLVNFRFPESTFHKPQTDNITSIQIYIFFSNFFLICLSIELRFLSQLEHSGNNARIVSSVPVWAIHFKSWTCGSLPTQTILWCVYIYFSISIYLIGAMDLSVFLVNWTLNLS